MNFGFNSPQIFEIVNLANELLPPLPEGIISLPASSNLLVKGTLVKKAPSSSSGKQEDVNGNVPEVSAREKLLNDQPELLQQFGMDLLPVLIQVSFLIHLVSSIQFIVSLVIGIFSCQPDLWIQCEWPCSP